MYGTVCGSDLLTHSSPHSNLRSITLDFAGKILPPGVNLGKPLTASCSRPPSACSTFLQGTPTLSQSFQMSVPTRLVQHCLRKFGDTCGRLLAVRSSHHRESKRRRYKRSAIPNPSGSDTLACLLRALYLAA